MREFAVVIVVAMLVVSSCSDDGDAAETSSQTPDDVTTSSLLPTTTDAGTTQAPTSTSSPTTTSTSSTTTTTSTTETTTTSSTSTSTTTTTTTTTTPPVTCAGVPPVELPAGAEVVSKVEGDLDQDGAKDTVQLYVLDDTRGLHVVLAHGWETARSLADVADDGPPAIDELRLVDIGDPAVLLELGGTLIGPRFGFVVLDDCALQPVQRGSGALPDFVLGGGAAHSEWFTCRDDRVTQLSVALPDGAQPSILTSWEYRYRQPSATVVLVAEQESDVTGSTLEDLLNEYPSCFQS